MYNKLLKNFLVTIKRRYINGEEEYIRLKQFDSNEPFR